MKLMSKQRKQSGSVLIVSLLILVVLTILGVSSMSTTSLEEKMAGNFRDRQIAFNAAETALAQAEDYINSDINSASVFNSTNGLYDSYDGPTAKNATDDTWWGGTNSIALSGDEAIDEVKTQPRYTIEYRGDVGADEGTSINIGGYGESSGGGAITSFRITVRATGLSDNSVVFLQSYYGKRL